MKEKSFIYFPAVITIIAIINYGRIYLLNDVVWDDNCWLLAAYASNNLDQFLNTGFYELRRAPMGAFLYYLLGLHKTTNHPYLIWHSINIIVQILTPIFFYLFIKGLFKGKELLSLFIAVSFVAFPLDYTLPYLTVVSYRIAIMLTMISFYLTVKALEKENPEYLLFLTAVLISAISYYAFLESTVFFEPARLFVIGYIFYSKGIKNNLLTRKAVIFWLPFFLLCIPLVSYKLIFKPYGIYDGIYKINFLFPLEWKEHAKMIRILLFYQWKIFLEYYGDVRFWTITISILAGIIWYILLKRLPSIVTGTTLQNNDSLKNLCFKEQYKWIWQSILHVLVLGIICLLPQIMLLEFAGREIGPGFNSSHFNQVQIGYAIIMGGFLYVFYMASINSHLKMRWINLSIALLIGFGALFNNLNLDLYSNASKKQMQFWTIFTERFPNLPQGATFLMDVRDFYYFDTTDLDNSYDLELYLNLLYAKSDDPAQFRAYKVLAMEEFKPEMAKDSCDNSQQGVIRRKTHFGEDALNPCEFIVIHYRNNELLVNQEILKKYPDVPYRNWADKAAPQLSASSNNYVLRHKLKEFIAQ